MISSTIWLRLSNVIIDVTGALVMVGFCRLLIPDASPVPGLLVYVAARAWSRS